MNILIVFVIFMTGITLAQNIVGYTSFEEPETGGQYVDTGNASEDHALINNDGQAAVNYDPGTTGSELGFSSYYTNTRGDVGLTDGDYFGVTNFTGDVTSFPDGSQGFQLSDCDGMVTVTVDTVVLNSSQSYTVSLHYFMKDGGYESDDYVRIWIETDAGATDLLNSTGNDIDDLGIVDQWNHLSQSISGASHIVVKFELDCNSGSEVLYVDYVVVSEGELPNIPPVADAGSDRVVAPETVVTLSGSHSSDSDGDIIDWQWTQIAGTTVTLSAPTEEVTTFTAPASEDSLVFTLTVTDDGDASDTDTVSVVVKIIEVPQIFFSEYIEGSTGNNKFLEIYNGSDEAIDLNAKNIVLAISSDGSNDFSVIRVENWGTHGVIQPGDVLVLASDGFTFSVTPDTSFTYPSPVHFNGNDAVALMANGVIFDIIGDPTSASDIIKDVVLRRNANVNSGNPVFTFDEWSYGTKDDVSDLGLHSANPNAPVISSISHMPAFVTSANEIEVSAIITPQVGTISSLVAKYGSSGSLINESTDSWEDDPDQHIWKVLLPTQPGNSRIEFKLVATDSEGNIGESTVQSFLVAGNLTDIADIHANIDALVGTIISIEGIITIGAGKLRDDRTDCYVQDESGRGLNLYSSEFHSDLERGTEVKVVGYAELYYTTVEITDFSYQVVSTNNDLPAPKSVSIAGANSDDNEGSWIQFYGELAERITMTDGSKLLIADGSDTTAVMIWNTTGVDVAALTDGESYWYRGVGSQYSGEHQLLVAYDEDIRSGTGIHDDPIRKPLSFRLEPAYPNPFNPTTTIAWQLAQAGDFRLSLFNLLGQEVAVLATGKAKPGKYSTLLHAEQMHSGMYFVRLESDGNVATQKIILLK